MGIQQFELFHGAVLAKLMRNDHPIALRMIQTTEDAWSVYTINTEVELFIKVSTTPNELSREEGVSWQFVFTPEQLEQIRSLHLSNKVAIALVCGQRNIKEEMQVAFLKPENVEEFWNFSETSSRSVTVNYIPRKKLRVKTDYTKEIKVAQNALDKWEVPGC